MIPSGRIPLVALVGRPNVGKSTLFNRLVGRRVSLVDNQPGVTRDRLFGEAALGDRLIRLVDTGGFDTNPEDPLLSQMRQQTQLAVEEADLVVVVLDSADGLRPADREVVQILRRSGKPLVAVVNKIDTPAHEERMADFYELGVDPLLPVSAEHCRGVGELEEDLIVRLDPPRQAEIEAASAPLPVAEDEPPEGVASAIEWDKGPIRVAVIGRPNVGKSSLINRILGEERLLATQMAGTTRDPVDTEVSWRPAENEPEQPFVLVDTAGLRRKRSIVNRLERFAVMAAVRALERADVAVVLLDGSARPSEQDARVAALAHQRGKGVVLAANKWDLVQNEEWRDRYDEAVRLDLPMTSYAALVRVSALTGRGIQRLLRAVVEAQRERHRRVSTSELNRFFRQVIERQPPRVFKGKVAKLYFVSQPLIRPPTFFFTASRVENISSDYARFLRNQLRKRYGFEGTPIWLKFRPRGKQKKQKSKVLDR